MSEEKRTDTELDAARRQLVVFAEEIKEIYRRERQRTRELERALQELNDTYLDTMKTLAFLVEAKDVGTRTHLDRAHSYGMALVRMMAPELARRPQIGYGFLLHDIGKIGISERILNKPGPLTSAEWSVMQTHPVIGTQIVAPMRFLGEAVEVIAHHHEKFDGSGYPRGLRADDIPLAARIFAIVDAFDAMTTDRPYRPSMPADEALEEIVRCSGRHFDPDVVEAFLLFMDGAGRSPAAATAS
ncbi:MAG TPA: HD domain-containing phosphohydrolase [Actinomycetota bacterium]|nr:HD domain-containing phosphohydrolase [Actinomycetota bacterium]